jgi:DNA-binding Lrp family transcriptional regulator
MDEKDIRILLAISELATDNLEDLEEHTKIPKSTIHNRISKLRKEGILMNDLNDIDLDRVGLSITIISEVWAVFEEGYHQRVGEKLADIESVNQVYFIMGDTDFIVISHLSSREMVEELIEEYESIEQIRRTSSKFVIQTVKDERHPLNDFELETLLEILPQS